MNNEKTNKKIIEAKKHIKEEKKKIKLEKKAIRRRRKEQYKKSKFGKTALGRFFGTIFFIFKEGDTYSFHEVFGITIVSLIIGFFACFSMFTILTGGKNIFKLSKDLSKLFDVYEVLTANYNGKLDKKNWLMKLLMVWYQVWEIPIPVIMI